MVINYRENNIKILYDIVHFSIGHANHVKSTDITYSKIPGDMVCMAVIV